MREQCAVAAFAVGKSANKLQDALPKIDWQRQNCAELDNDRVHFPEPIVKINTQQRFANAQMRGGAHRKKFGQPFNDPQKDRQQIIVHKLRR